MSLGCGDSMIGLWNAAVLSCLIACGGAALIASDKSPTKATPQKVETRHLPNTYRITKKVLSGGLPDGEAGFAELEALGVKTVISVDGMTPDVDGAKKHGLRYVHLPHGYDRVPLERGQELAKAVRDLPGPVYIHCHHGKHRSPSAAAVACVEAGLISPELAEGVLKAAGTNPNYRGLYESVRNARPLSSKELDQLKVEFRETSPVPPLAEAMVELEHALDRVKGEGEMKWHRKADSQSAALLLLEQFKEMQRLDDVKKRPARFREILTGSEEATLALQAALAGNSIETSQAEAAIKAITKGCADCHAAFRDNAP
jgi:hypothetical protein